MISFNLNKASYHGNNRLDGLVRRNWKYDMIGTAGTSSNSSCSDCFTFYLDPFSFVPVVKLEQEEQVPFRSVELIRNYYRNNKATSLVIFAFIYFQY